MKARKSALVFAFGVFVCSTHLGRAANITPLQPGEGQAGAMSALPTIAGGLTVSMNPRNGSAVATIPFSLPAARGAVQPLLALSYDSSLVDGEVGTGWSLAIPAITRHPLWGFPTYKDPGPNQAITKDVDPMEFGGQPLVPICTVGISSCPANEIMPAWATGWHYFRQRIDDLHARLFWSPDGLSWRVEHKSGEMAEFGVVSGIQQDTGGIDAELTQPPFRWNLVRKWDGVTGQIGPRNLVRYVWKHLGNLDRGYLTDIYDTGLASSPGFEAQGFAHHTRLLWEPQPFPVLSGGNRIFAPHDQRLIGVDVTSKDLAAIGPRHLVRRYHLSYKAASHHSYLVRVQEEGACAANSPIVEQNDDSLPPSNCERFPYVSMSYSNFGFGDPLQSPICGSMQSLPTTSGPGPSAKTALVDFNQDGLIDVLEPAQNAKKPQKLFLNKTQLSNSRQVTGQALEPHDVNAPTTCGVNDSLLASGHPSAVADWFLRSSEWIGTSSNTRAASVFFPLKMAGTCNSDQDCCGGAQCLGNQCQAIPWLWEANASSLTWNPLLFNFFNSPPPNIEELAVDINSDGLLDTVAKRITNAAVPLRFSTSDGQSVGVFSKSVNVTPGIVQCGGLSICPEAYADMNGDGLPDHVWPSSTVGVRYEPGDGRGGFLPQVLMNLPQLAPLDGALRFAFFHDLDGDGLADLISEHLGSINFWHNLNGQSFEIPNTADFQGKLVKITGNAKLSIGDMNGNGTDDLVIGDAPCGHCYEFWDCGGAIGPDVGLLTNISSGAGLFTTVQYANTTDLDAVWQWKTHIPRSMRVVQSINTVVGGTGLPGIANAATARVFFYADPIYVGSRHALHGFRRVRVRTSASPLAASDTTAVQHVESETSYFIPPDGVMDRRLTPLPYQIDVFGDASSNSDMTGLSPPSSVYKTTTFLHYKVEEVLTGITNETVKTTYPDVTDTYIYIYDTDNFTRQDQTINQEIVDFIFFKTPCPGGNCKGETPIPGTVTLHSSKYEHLRTTQSIDAFGNIQQSDNFGRVNVDPVITTQLAPQTDWTWRLQSQSTDPFGNGLARTKTFIYDPFGNVTDEYAVLNGTLPLARHHENANKAIAPPPSLASQNGSVHLVHRDYDIFGNVTQELGPNGQCTAFDYDMPYRQLVKSKKVFIDGNGCSGSALSTETTFNRQFGEPTMTVDPSGAVTQFEYDGFGRLMRRLDPDPQTIGMTSSVVSVDYSPRSPGEPQPDQDVGFFRTHVADPSGETWVYTDGAGKTFAILNKADPNAGDGGEWRVSGFTHLTVAGEVVTFAPWFYTGNPASFPSLFLPPQNQATERTAFEILGRPRMHVARDGTTTARYTYGPLLVQAAEVDGANNVVHSTTATWNGHGRVISALHPTANDVRTVEFFYQATGEIVRMRQSTVNGQDAFERTMAYDSMGRLVSTHDPNMAPIGWHYAYDDSGRLVGSSDPRGCGKNITYDGLDRVRTEDWSPCLDSQSPYSPPLSTGDGTEALYVYDAPEQQVALPSAFLGKIAALYDLGSHTRFDYDGRGRGTSSARQIVNPGSASILLSNRYTPHFFQKSLSFDDANRITNETTGADVQELLGVNASSEIAYDYTNAGLIRGINSSYGPLVAQIDYDVEGLARKTILGDRAKTYIEVTPDVRRRTSSLVIARGPPASSPQCGDWGMPCGSYTPPSNNTPSTLQETLEDLTFTWDRFNKLKELKDNRNASEWSSGFQPVTRTFDYDEHTRSLTKIRYSHGNDQQVSPFAVEEANSDARPLPHQVLANRVGWQSFHYDWANRPDVTDDDQHALFDRSLGSISYAAGTHQIESAGGGAIRPTYDVAGNLVNLVVDRSGSSFQCSLSQKCTQRFVFDWDEVGELARARRWDYSTLPQNDPPWPQVPATGPDIDLTYAYSQGARVLKSLATGSGVVHTLDVFDSLRLDRTTFSQNDYVRSPETESVYLGSLAHVVYIPDDVPSLTSGHRRVLMLLGDHLGSTSSVVDHETGELVERITYAGFGATDSDYRPARWAYVREQSRYTAKQDDFEVGLTYFGARYYSPYLDRWISADPLVVHASSGFDPYSFVQNNPSTRVDPAGLCSFDNLSADACWPIGSFFTFDPFDPFGRKDPWTLGGGGQSNNQNGPTSQYFAPIIPTLPTTFQEARTDGNVRGEGGFIPDPNWHDPTTFAINFDAFEGLRQGFTQGTSSDVFALTEVLSATQMAFLSAPFLAEFGASSIGAAEGLGARALTSPLGSWVNPLLYGAGLKLTTAAIDALSEVRVPGGASEADPTQTGGLWKIQDGVRRAKAAQLSGIAELPAEFLDPTGRTTISTGTVRVESLLSPKPVIDTVTMPGALTRWLNTLRLTAGGSVPPPIRVLPVPPDALGTPISQVRVGRP